MIKKIGIGFGVLVLLGLGFWGFRSLLSPDQKAKEPDTEIKVDKNKEKEKGPDEELTKQKIKRDLKTGSEIEEEKPVEPNAAADSILYDVEKPDSPARDDLLEKAKVDVERGLTRVYAGISDTKNPFDLGLVSTEMSIMGAVYAVYATGRMPDYNTLKLYETNNPGIYQYTIAFTGDTDLQMTGYYALESGNISIYTFAGNLGDWSTGD